MKGVCSGVVQIQFGLNPGMALSLAPKVTVHAGVILTSTPFFIQFSRSASEVLMGKVRNMPTRSLTIELTDNAQYYAVAIKLYRKSGDSSSLKFIAHNPIESSHFFHVGLRLLHVDGKENCGEWNSG